jgi:hypothetical protein
MKYGYARVSTDGQSVESKCARSPRPDVKKCSTSPVADELRSVAGRRGRRDCLIPGRSSSCRVCAAAGRPVIAGELGPIPNDANDPALTLRAQGSSRPGFRFERAGSRPGAAPQAAAFDKLPGAERGQPDHEVAPPLQQ